MPDVYDRNLPPADVAVELPPEELALFVLRFLSDPTTGGGGMRSRFNFLDRVRSARDSSTYGAGVDREELALSLAEAWAWLEREGLIVLSPQASSGDWVVVSRRGRLLTSKTDFDAYKRGNLLRRDSLDPLLEQKVWPLFIRGDYEVAVFQAFKLIEVQVRGLCGYPDTLYGVTLMRKAFDPEEGPLTDDTQPVAEREAVASLFAGAIGFFKNPSSHRTVAWDAAEAAEAIVFANTLLRLLNRAATLSE